MVAASATGERFPVFIIMSKSKNTCCFRNVKHLPCQYVAQKKSCMNSQIFQHWVHKLDRKFRVDGRKIAIIIDDCPVHLPISNLTNIQLVFLLSNVTSNEDTCWFLKCHNKGNCYELFQEDWNQLWYSTGCHC